MVLMREVVAEPVVVRRLVCEKVLAPCSFSTWNPRTRLMSPLARLTGRWRAVPILGLTQVLTWGALFYPPVLTLPLLAADRGFSLTFAMSGFSFGLLCGGLVAPRIGRLIDHYGGHRVMAVGSLAGAIGLVLLVQASDPLLYLSIWALLGGAMAASLYDPAFATLGRIFGREARKSITLLTFIGGFASTVSWPTTYFLLEGFGWRGTYLIYAALLAIVAAPLHFFALPRERADLRSHEQDAGAPVPKLIPARGFAFVLVAAAFAVYAFVPSALSAHMLAIFERMGVEAATVILIGTLFGPSQVTARLCEFIFARNLHPLDIARFAVGLLIFAFLLLAMLGVPAPVAAVFAILFGAANGLLTISRGTVPLALFGPSGYGGVIGRIAGPSLVLQAAAPLVIAFAAEQISDIAALTVIAGMAAISFVAFLAVRKPR
jgi:predicted MFS family arabinose efflux permease